MPRKRRYGEVVNNHQGAIARKFVELRHLLAAYEADKLLAKMEQLRTFVPRKRETQPSAVVNRIARFLHELSTNSPSHGA